MYDVQLDGLQRSRDKSRVQRIQITPAKFILIFDFMPDGGATDGHASLPDSGNICMELKFDDALSEAVTILLHLEFDASIQIDPD